MGFNEPGKTTNFRARSLLTRLDLTGSNEASTLAADQAIGPFVLPALIQESQI